MPPIIFKKPPVVEVGISLQFPNTLEVADDRSKFQRLVRAEFPQVVVPEQSKLPFDFGDYILYTENLSERIEIGMNYVRFVTTSYPGFVKFRTKFLGALSMFRQAYALEAFSNFFYYYNNKLPIEGQKTFQECFTLVVNVPEKFQKNFMTGQGVLVFQEAEGFVAVEFRPESKENQIEVTSYSFSLRFGALRKVVLSEELDELGPLVDVGHKHLEDYFFSLLQPNFVKFLESR